MEAAKSAYLWPEEVASAWAQGQSLAEFHNLKGSALRLVEGWLDAPPQITAPAKVRQDFMTMAEAKAVLHKHRRRSAGLKGDLQMHTKWSDGSGTILEMTAAAVERGYEYIALTDHTAGLTIANGMDERQVEAQGAEIDRVNEALQKNGVRFTVLHAVELNLSESGAGDLRPGALKKLDLVLGSFHSGLNTKRDQTSRYLAALRNPHVHILGHPQTRRWNKRLGLEADWPRVFAEAARLGKAIEVDGYAERQDLRQSLLKIAKAEGCFISLGSDAHRAEQLDYITFSLASIFTAGIPLARVLNFWDARQVLKWAGER
ncbi:PHP domain-containing protein [Roseimicrobium sp. ORNL1]|uniref:PHP domain-containing protein n=1 Tax=Roseimicrobium sp. ORNL1 TaxID=2711231 RepID=UPI0013E126D2|nr:PHP domain-containing protein [Roseimicrobium sp. ORNL1]QIF02872.1 hypothetical protein G5S37_15540 [Roseimicrobium sp. ORNL1]